MAGYGTDAELSAWATENGYILPATPLPAVLRELGSTYVDSMYGRCFLGRKTGGYDQERSWPRTGAVVDGELVPSEEIPLAVVRASYRAAVAEGLSPGSLEVIVDRSRRIKRQKVEFAVEREFFEGGTEGATTGPSISTIDGLLSQFVDHVCMGWDESDKWAWIKAVG